MFGIGLSEIIVILLVAIILLDNEKLKDYIRLLKNIYSKINVVKKDLHNYIESLDETTNIVGDDGKIYKAYKLNTLNNNSLNNNSTKQNNDSTDTSSR